jgi:hypothetical protein
MAPVRSALRWPLRVPRRVIDPMTTGPGHSQGEGCGQRDERPRMEDQGDRGRQPGKGEEKQPSMGEASAARRAQWASMEWSEEARKVLARWLVTTDGVGRLWGWG